MRLVLLTTLLIAVAACRPEAGIDPAEHAEEVEAWRQGRLDALREPESWPSLAGLYWLDEGEHAFGGDPANDIVFPAPAPARIGTFVREGEKVRVEVAPGVDVRHDGAPVDTLTLRSDAGGSPAKLTLGPLSWHLIERSGRLGVRLYDRSRSAALTADALPHFPVDPAWRIEGAFERYDPPRTLAVPTILGTDADMVSPGAVVFEVGGASYRLDVVEGDTATYFVIFGDETNRDRTYQAGRYVYIGHEDEAGRVVIDFNKAYNPPCVFTPYATCPFPPSQNRLALPVTAGELRYEGAELY